MASEEPLRLNFQKHAAGLSQFYCNAGFLITVKLLPWKKIVSFIFQKKSKWAKPEVVIANFSKI